MKKNGVIDVMRVFQTGDTVSLLDTYLLGQKGTIVQIDYRKQRAKIVFSFSGMECFTWVACEMIDANALDIFNG